MDAVGTDVVLANSIQRSRSSLACQSCRNLKSRCLPSNEAGKCQRLYEFLLIFAIHMAQTHFSTWLMESWLTVLKVPRLQKTLYLAREPATNKEAS